MQKKYAAQGLSAVSVSVDEDVKKAEVQEKILKFLQSQKATFTNLILDEEPQVWQKKLRFDGAPCVFVFNQDGKIAKQFKDDFTYDDVEKTVKSLLEKK
jgi:hypothetical protein